MNYVLKSLDAFKSTPDNLDGATLDNDGKHYVVVVRTSGDSKYKNLIRYFNANAAEKWRATNDDKWKTKIYESLTGAPHKDDCHVINGEYGHAAKTQQQGAAAQSLVRAAVQTLKFNKGTTLLHDRNPDLSLKSAPKERYFSHLGEMLKPFVVGFADIVWALIRTDWKKLSALKNVHSVVEIMCKFDVTDSSKMALAIMQRTQNWRGYIFLCMRLMHDALIRFVDDKQFLVVMAEHYLESRNLFILYDNVIKLTFFRSLTQNLRRMIHRGALDGVVLSFLATPNEIKANEYRYNECPDDYTQEQIAAKQQHLIESLELNKNGGNVRYDEQEDDEQDDLDHASDDSSDDNASENDDSSSDDEQLEEEKQDEIVMPQRRNRKRNRLQIADSDTDDDQEEELQHDEPVVIEVSNHQHNVVIPTRSRRATDAQHVRACVILELLLKQYHFVDEFMVKLFGKKGKKWHEMKQSEEAKLYKSYFPQLIFDICNEATLDDIELRGNDELAAVYMEYQRKNARQSTTIFFEATAEQIISGFVRFKRQCFNILTLTDDGKKLATKYVASYQSKRPESHEKYAKILCNLEEDAKIAIAAVASHFILFWEILQSKVASSSAFCEPLGNYIKLAVKGGNGSKVKDHDRIEKAVAITLHTSSSEDEQSKFVRGASNYLCDIGKGAVCVKSRPLKHAGGKVAKRTAKGYHNKYTQEWHMNRDDVTLALHEED